MHIVIKTGAGGPELVHLSESAADAEAAYKAVELESGERVHYFRKPESYKQRRGKAAVDPTATIDNFPASGEKLGDAMEAAAAAEPKKGKR